jgi:hypothetical protein
MGLRADLLVASENGIGGTTYLATAPTQWDNTGGDGVSDRRSWCERSPSFARTMAVQRRELRIPAAPMPSAPP